MTGEQRDQLIAQIAKTLPLPKEIERDFAAFTTDTVMGGLWQRGGLAPRERSMITIAALTVQKRLGTPARESMKRLTYANGSPQHGPA